MLLNPYVVGQWVRGERFYGRKTLIDAILTGNRNCLWVLGTRRIGKTSLLKQVEMVASESRDYGYFPVFWDFQGAEHADDLHDGFADSLLDVEDRLEACGVDLQDVEAKDLFASLRKLRRSLHAKGLKLLLLCDEVEELVGLNERDPSLLRKLRRSMQSQDDIRSVLASKIKLWELSREKADTSPFLEGFTPPLFIQPLEADEARALIRQVNLPSDSRPRFDEDAVELVRERCHNHPYLIQLLCESFMELDDLPLAIEQLASDPMVSYFFSVDFEMLTETERQILSTVAEHSTSTTDVLRQETPATSSTLDGSLHRLENLGYIRRDDEGRFELANFFFKQWYRGAAERPAPGGVDDSGMAERPQMESAQFSITRLGRDDSETPGAEISEVFDERYELVERIGKGATGVVYKAYDSVLRVHIAIKVLRPEYASNDEALERLRREILLSRDMAHPNILRLYHLSESKGKKYITMQWMNGPTLAQLIARDGPFLPRRVVRIATALASALETAHHLRVLHRDIKPQNILMDANDEPRITDFGLARLLGDPGVTGDGVFVGTPDYSSPEQANLRPLDERSDLYSLGVVIFEMLTGRKPFHSDSVAGVLEKHRSAALPSLAEDRPEIPEKLVRIVERCLEKDPEDRFRSAGEIKVALEAL